MIADVAVVETAITAVRSWLAEHAASGSPQQPAWASPLLAALSEQAAFRRHAIAPFLKAVPPGRVAAAVTARIRFERADTPVYSLYLAALLELQVRVPYKIVPTLPDIHD